MQVCLDGSGSDMAQVGETFERSSAQAVGRLCREHCANIYMASFFLSPRKRLAIQAAGAFMHMIEEALDVTPNSSSACASGGELNARLAMIKERLELMESGVICSPEIGAGAQDAVIRVMSSAMQRYQISRQWFSDMADAMALRARTLRIATWTSLEKYLQARGGSAGLIISAILGVTRSEAQDCAIEMGMAIDLTRLLRDLKKDTAANRILLPLEDLIRFKYSEKELTRGTVNDNFQALMKFQINRARQMYQSAAEGIPWLGGDGSRLAASTIAVLYSGLLRAIERRHHDVFSGDVKLNAAQRARRIIDAWRLARGRSTRGWI